MNTQLVEVPIIENWLQMSPPVLQVHRQSWRQLCASWAQGMPGPHLRQPMQAARLPGRSLRRCLFRR